MAPDFDETPPDAAPVRAGGGYGMSLTRINETGEPEVTPASDG